MNRHYVETIDGLDQRLQILQRTAAADTDLGDLRALAGVAKFPVRVKCALLAWNCLDEMVGPGATPS